MQEPVTTEPPSAGGEEMYQVIGARRTQLDQLLWQAPALSLTAQAFLFTIALDPATARFSRVIVSFLSLVVAVLTCNLIDRHRSAEQTDSGWLRKYELDRFQVTFHGRDWARRRNEEKIARGFNWIGRLRPGYVVWITGMALFGIAA